MYQKLRCFFVDGKKPQVPEEAKYKRSGGVDEIIQMGVNMRVKCLVQDTLVKRS